MELHHEEIRRVDPACSQTSFVPTQFIKSNGVGAGMDCRFAGDCAADELLIRHSKCYLILQSLRGRKSLSSKPKAGCSGGFVPCAVSERTLMIRRIPVRVITRAASGGLRIRDNPTARPLLRWHTKIGVADYSKSLELRRLLVFRDLVGPIANGKRMARYELPEIFEMLTREWAKD
jgi:hypothetical protein